MEREQAMRQDHDGTAEPRLLRFFKATLFGGVIFLLPLVLIAVLIGKAVGMAINAGEPVFRLLPHSAFWLALIPVLALLALVLVALLAGLFARTGPGQRLLAWIESSLFGGVPQYQMMKSMAEGVARLEGNAGWKPVLVPAGTGWRIGFLVEPFGADWATVFLPQSPSATIGEVVLLPQAGLQPLALTTAEAGALIKRMGVGMADALAGQALLRPGEVLPPPR